MFDAYSGGRPPTFTLSQRQQVKKIALSRPMDHGLPFSTWSLTKLAEFLVAEGVVVDDISHEGLRDLLHKEGISFQVIKTFKQSNDPEFEAKKDRVLELYDIADNKAEPGPGDPTVVVVAWTSSAPSTCCPDQAGSGRRWRRRRTRTRPPPPGPLDQLRLRPARTPVSDADIARGRDYRVRVTSVADPRPPAPAMPTSLIGYSRCAAVSLPDNPCLSTESGPDTSH
jgi:hypothetical protein